MATNQKTNKDYKAEEVLDKLNYWYKILDYHTCNTPESSKLRQDMVYIRDAIIHMNGDKQADHLRFAKMFKKLFAKQNKELVEENLELKKEIAEIKMEERVKEKQENDND